MAAGSPRVTRTVRVHGFAASHTHMFSSTLINEARFGLSREHTYRLQPNGDDISNLPAKYGITGVPQVTGNGGLPQLNIGGLSQLGHADWVVSERFSNTAQFSDNLTKLYKSHTFKGGYIYQDIFFGSTQPPYARGDYNWDGRYTSVVNQTDGTTGRAGLAALADPIAGAGRRRLFGRDERDPCLSVRVRRCVQDLSWRLRSGQLACERETDGERRPPLGLVQPRTGAPGRTVQHGARPAVAVLDSGGAP